MRPPPPARGNCVECGKPLAAHKGVQTHMYRRADGFQASYEVPRRPTVDEMATEFLMHGSIVADAAPAMGMSAAEATAAIGQAMGVGWLKPDTPVAKIPLSRAGTPMKHRRFPCRWWQRGCRCYECNRTPDYAHIKAMEIECEIRGEDGNLVWPPPPVGSQDRYGRTVVAHVDGQPVWDRPAPPAPPARDPGRRQWV